MTNQEKFDIEYDKPVDVQDCYKALTDFIKRKAILRVPARADDPDMLIGRALRQLKQARELIKALTEENIALNKAKNNAYAERNRLAIALALIALRSGYSAGKGIDDNENWEESWRNVVYIEFPNGTQVSWHMSPEEIHLLDILPEFEKSWDGTFLSRNADWIKEI